MKTRFAVERRTPKPSLQTETLPGREGIRLTNLGRDIVDHKQTARAKVDAFLHVPLCREIYRDHAGGLLPNNIGLERYIRDLGVASKQVDKARQAFQRSAQEAGFFKEGNNKLVRPAVGGNRVDESPPPEKPRQGAGGPDEPRLHPFIKGRVETLRSPGEPWPEDGQEQWLTAAKAIFKLIYPSASGQPPPSAQSPADAQD